MSASMECLCADVGAVRRAYDRDMTSYGVSTADKQSAFDEPGRSARKVPTIRIVIADDHQIVRRGLRYVLESEPDFDVVAEASDVDSARRYVRGHRPDVLVMDVNMPGGPSIESIPAIRAESPETNIVVLTMQNDPAFARQALSHGALGYVLKEAADTELVVAVRGAAAGESYLNPRLGAKVAAEPVPGGPGALSGRETEVLRMIAHGNTNAQIAEKMFLSIRTVETHRAHVQQKLGLSDRSELVAYALDSGLLRPAAKSR
jgi:two-component system response regulator NreC